MCPNFIAIIHKAYGIKSTIFIIAVGERDYVFIIKRGEIIIGGQRTRYTKMMVRVDPQIAAYYALCCAFSGFLLSRCVAELARESAVIYLVYRMTVLWLRLTCLHSNRVGK